MEIADSPCVLLLDLTHSALAGIDLLSFTTTPKFKGIKNLPHGLHFVFCSTTSDLSVRHGAWFEIPPGTQEGRQPLFVKKWNPATEQLDQVIDTAEILRWRANLGSIWKEGLSPYRQSASSGEEAKEESDDWSSLTDHITSQLLSKLVGYTPNHWSLTSASSAKQDLEAIPGLAASSHVFQEEKELNLIPIDLKRPWREGATGRERTEAALDHSYYLQEMIDKCCLDRDAKHILGEMQFCFLMVLTLNNYSCLEQWKRILTLVLTSHSIISELADFYVGFLALLRLQLKSCALAEGGLFDLADESGSLLKSLLHKFRLGLKDLPGSTSKSDVMDELDELEDYLRGEHGWELDNTTLLKKGMLDLVDGERVEMDVGAAFDEEDEEGEYAPAVVELTAEQMAELGITEEDVKKMTRGKEGQRVNDLQDEVHSVDERESEGEEESEDDRDLEDMDDRY
jgi:A1 cistron-splicing factor AAR2